MTYAERVQQLEAEGLSTSDAQGVADAEALKGREFDFDPRYPLDGGRRRAARLTSAQTEAARARVAGPFPSGWTYWTKEEDAPFYGTRAEAERASIEEWRANL